VSQDIPENEEDFVALGWLHEQEDRDYLATGGTFTAPAVDRIPKIIDPSDAIAVRNQGHLGSCAGHGMTCGGNTVQWLESSGRTVVDLAPGFTYYMGQKRAGLSGDVGCTIAAVVDSACNDGMCREQTEPYRPEYDPSEVTERAIAEAAKHKMRRHVQLRTWAEVFAWLATGQGAVVIGTWWTEEMANVGPDGLLTGCGGQKLGGHCTCYFGYRDRKDDDGRNWLLQRNSHSKRWAKNGTAEVKPTLIDQLLEDNFTVMIGVTDLESYDQGPRRTAFLLDNPW
jgi:hypothetical protein